MWEISQKSFDFCDILLYWMNYSELRTEQKNTLKVIPLKPNSHLVFSGVGHFLPRPQNDLKKIKSVFQSNPSNTS